MQQNSLSPFLYLRLRFDTRPAAGKARGRVADRGPRVYTYEYTQTTAKRCACPKTGYARDNDCNVLALQACPKMGRKSRQGADSGRLCGVLGPVDAVRRGIIQCEICPPDREPACAPFPKIRSIRAKCDSRRIDWAQSCLGYDKLRATSAKLEICQKPRPVF